MKMMSRTYKTSTWIGIMLAVFCAVCRCSVSVADWYALNLYPIISDVLSWCSSPIPFSLEEITIVAIILLAIIVICIGFKRHWGWRRCLVYEGTILLWTYVWFYVAWCNNYSRSNIFDRVSAPVAEYDKAEFIDFCRTIIHEANNNWTKEAQYSQDQLETEIKSLYADVPKKFGLSTPRSWHHPKAIMFRSVYSSVGILGFMAPLFGESLLNGDLQDYDYPFTYAHEYAHMLGISSEAEANWWAFNITTCSKSKSVRYSGYKGILPYVLNNARLALTQQEYENLFDSIDERIIEDLDNTRIHWRSKRSPLLRSIHEWTYDTFLKSNNIATGIKNYSEVISMLISLKDEKVTISTN